MPTTGEPNEADPPAAMGPQDFSAANDWPGYFGAVLGKPPRDTLLAALAAFEHEGVTAGVAVDLASGEGRDTLALLERGCEAGLLFSVTADRVIRLVPPLVLTVAEADEIVALLAPLVKAFLAEPAQ